MLQNATIVFDLDGTLVDTAPDLTNALNHALGIRALEPVAPSKVREAVGRGAPAMIYEALGPDADIDGILADFLVHYEANIAAESRPFDGAVAAMDRLAEAGATLAICTNKRERLAVLLLRTLKLDHYFSAIAGRDTLNVAKPDPGHLLGVIAAAGGDPSHAVMVGDSVKDIGAAKAAGIPSIFVSFGYCPPPPEGPHADAVIDHFADLEPCAARLLARLTDGAEAPS